MTEVLCYTMLSHFSRVQLCVTPETAATRLPRPWDSPGKNTGVGCHFLLQCMKVKSEIEVAQSCPTLSDPMDCSPPGSSVHGIFQARVLEWGAAYCLPPDINSKMGECLHITRMFMIWTKGPEDGGTVQALSDESNSLTHLCLVLPCFLGRIFTMW